MRLYSSRSNGKNEAKPSLRGLLAFKHPFVLILALSLFFASNYKIASASEDRINWAVKADEMNREAVVCIQGDKVDDFGDFSKELGKSYNGMGTGIIIDERGYIITNYHVVEGIRKIQVMTYDRKQYIASLVARDPDTDLAIIKIRADKALQTIHFGRSDDLMAGEHCLAIGNPYGYPFSVTTGRISGLGRKVDVNDTLSYLDAIQISTEINPGNSGGPLINVNGQMIGINAAIRQGAQGIAFAIPVDQVIDVAAKLVTEIADKNIYLGARVYQKDTEKQTTGRLSERESRVIVESVDSNSPAAKAGLQKGDIITAVGATNITNKLDFYRALLDSKSRDDLVFNVSRNDESVDVAVSMGSPRDNMNASRNSGSRTNRRGSSPSRAETSPKAAAKPANTLDELVWQTLGIRYEPMPKDEYQRKFAQYLNEHPFGGVIVKAVREDSQMAEKGVMPGDVIVGIHEWATTSQNDIRYIAKTWSTLKVPEDKVRLLLFRDAIPYFTELPIK